MSTTFPGPKLCSTSLKTTRYKRVGWADLLGSLRYGPEFHATRKIFQQQLSRAQCTENYRDAQLKQGHTLLRKIVQAPEDFHAHLTWYVCTNSSPWKAYTSPLTCSYMSSILSEIAYGHHVSGPDDSFPHIAERVTEILDGSGTPGLNIVDIFPIC